MEHLFFGHKDSMRVISAHLILIFLLGGCTLTPLKQDSETMYIKGSALTKLSAAVEAAVHFDAPPDTLNDHDLLVLSTQDDPTLLEPFTEYLVKVNREFNHAILLVCNKEATQGFLEDAGCSASMDSHLWQRNVPCAFTLSSNVICAQ